MIGIVKYNAGNIRSVENAVKRLGFNCVITDDPGQLEEADKVIFPGVGEASSAMRYLNSNGLAIVIKNLRQPVLGICLGQQLLCNHSEEGDTDCLGIYDADVKRFPDSDIVPHMGWNNLDLKPSKLWNGFTPESDVYFVHGYYVQPQNDTIAICNYILPFAAAMQKNNFYATQFHPEKSGSTGELILQNFLNL